MARAYMPYWEEVKRLSPAPATFMVRKSLAARFIKAIVKLKWLEQRKKALSLGKLVITQEVIGDASIKVSLQLVPRDAVKRL